MVPSSLYCCTRMNLLPSGGHCRRWERAIHSEDPPSRSNIPLKHRAYRGPVEERAGCEMTGNGGQLRGDQLSLQVVRSRTLL
jgi:hypothetical protein